MIPPWELVARPDRDYWRAWALSAEAAEADSQRMAGELGGLGASDD